MNSDDQAVLEHFLDSMWMERGLSRNTLQAYRNDLKGLSAWLAKRGLVLLTASRADLLEYLAFRGPDGCKPPGQRAFAVQYAPFLCPADP